MKALHQLYGMHQVGDILYFARLRIDRTRVDSRTGPMFVGNGLHFERDLEEHCRDLTEFERAVLRNLFRGQTEHDWRWATRRTVAEEHLRDLGPDGDLEALHVHLGRRKPTRGAAALTLLVAAVLSIASTVAMTALLYGRIHLGFVVLLSLAWIALGVSATAMWATMVVGQLLEIRTGSTRITRLHNALRDSTSSLLTSDLVGASKAGRRVHLNTVQGRSVLFAATDATAEALVCVLEDHISRTQGSSGDADAVPEVLRSRPRELER